MTRHSKDGPILYKCRSHGRQARCPRTGTAGANDGGDAVTKPRAGGIRVGSGSSGTAHLAIGGEQQVPSLRARSSGPCKEGGEWTWAVEGSALNLSYMLSATTGHVEATAKKVQGQVARPGCNARHTTLDTGPYLDVAVDDLAVAVDVVQRLQQVVSTVPLRVVVHSAAAVWF